MDTIKNVVGNAREKLEDLEDLARDTASDAVTDLRRLIKRHPLESVAIALGVGVLIGAAIRLRR